MSGRGRRPLRVGIVGCGAIGSALAQYVTRRLVPRARLVAVCDRQRLRAQRLARRLVPPPAVVPLADLVRRSDLVIEAASADVVPTLVRCATAARRDTLIMSAGGLLQAPSLLRLAAARGCRLYVPSGALPGIDGVKAARLGRIRRITLTTRKPPAALADAPGVLRRRLALSGLRRPRLVFEGPPAAAVRAFPRNINICATVALAAGRCPITVRVVATPGLRGNVHELEVIGDVGTFRLRTESRPDAANPRTSRMAVASATACLQTLVEYVRIGT